MNKATKSGLGILAGIMLLGFAGTMDYTEEVIYNMPEETYMEIKSKLGNNADDYEIAKEYTSNYSKTCNYDK